MQILNTSLSDVKLLQPKRFSDERGWFAEVFNSSVFEQGALPSRFVQDNQSYSRQGVLRGLHYQVQQQQGKLVRAVSGHIWDVAVDLRRNSPEFGKWAGFHLTAEEGNMLWIPEGFAHGFLVLSAAAEVLYKTTNFYAPGAERCVRWDDATLAIEWPLGTLARQPIVSGKDAAGSLLQDAELPAV
ncbi:dTDP-4-dehydrorhamnose 3,5-epimerase [Acidipila sp. EB88]|uniref:dTDP-4-dehydrorhamnose 3,5-epimerase n=1 Tax=Acidipila sp. EB88 TaxID=2305226 RepID=UPI000F5F2946|nr:dTDP-4-dehydrorhamnose 3,5-epimerase [Acidipila sp. EB88]RRA47454.1 dTDP-4-dehydrorhamnose 3,5-epimerase [Acidipila sp. EB88]